ncbi:hypothetical protein [Celeribacter marinus]|uniref:calcium-binding protein n=1 Tax=Celeribacter marinus TaxID=1397108 RepID=UPI0031739422
MLWAFALLGILPAAFMFVEASTPDEDDASDDMSVPPPSDEDATSSGLAELLSGSALVSSIQGELEGDDPPALLPNDPEEIAMAGPVGSNSDDLSMLSDPDAPSLPGPIGSDLDDVLDANTAVENVTGDQSGEITTYTLDDSGDALALPDDRQQGGSDATIRVVDGVASLDTNGTLNVVTGGLGADTIGAGDDAAIVFGNAGDDEIFAGDGSAILYGGDGDDTLVAGSDAHSDYYLHGGTGRDAFVMEFDSEAGQPTIEIADFDPLVDTITIEVDPVTAADGPVVLGITPTDDGLSSVIRLNSISIATVTGIVDLDPGVVTVTGV